MNSQPFALLSPFADRIAVSLFAKEDDLITDHSVMQALHGKDYAALDQVHGNRTLVTRQMIRRTASADGLITDQAHLTLMIRIADCQPLIVYAPDTNIIGVLHVGWKGLLCKAIEGFFEQMQNEMHVDPSTCFVGIGPCLCTACAEFQDPLRELPGIPHDLVTGKQADLGGWADRQLMACGVSTTNIERVRDCTRCHPEKYWTYRGGDREAVKSGATNVLACMLQ
ncbi:polyphenol oxidase family protein [Candidatus Peribacteria bacterium]|nr:polyphenol oxidase family protein [Candidatus Peribacteria bacterium]